MKNTLHSFALILFSTLIYTPMTAAESQQEARPYQQVFADLALHCIHQEYPNVIKHMMNNELDLKTPSELYPAFYGCLDWHSSVHGHWLLVRMLNTHSNKIDAAPIYARLAQSFTSENLAGELSSYSRQSNASFERPYGLAWYLQLMTELRQASFPQAQAWLNILQPLEAQIVNNATTWLHKLAYPIRTGEHSQTAFAFGLMLDWSRISGNAEFEKLLTARILHYYEKDQHCPIAYEPSGQDFLSPCLAEADLMRRVMTKPEFSEWLTDFFPQLTQGDEQWLTPATVIDKSDGKLAHLDGLNLSRSWMLEGIINALDNDDPRQSLLNASFRAHKAAGLNSVFGDMHYMGSHWLGSFATYLETQRGIKK